MEKDAEDRALDPERAPLGADPAKPAAAVVKGKVQNPLEAKDVAGNATEKTITNELFTVLNDAIKHPRRHFGGNFKREDEEVRLCLD
ncbi:hypothetical protein D1AOALGA4SA_10226 [Olavius algarvensis Delta 1 endosymbiont]|nr:hypothetical protein D1AOALGA4SA_10226 [Olavius algarvensis Delta 1 endosymbiont]